MPRVHVPRGQNDFSIGVGFNEFFGKCTSGPVTHSLPGPPLVIRHGTQPTESYLAVTKELIPFFPTKFSHAIVFGRERVAPHEAVGRVLNTGTHHMIRVDISESLQGLAESYCTRD